ncbi:MAG: hypothetical protein FGM57_02570 [Candidatus Taylorbacteria bacterium]|nr:hypothetical protein [Candidatus Taylorbacteria bacterium]
MNLETLMGHLAIFFGVLGSWGLYKQARMIWSSKSAESVSGVWVILFLAMFTAFLIYGTQRGSFPMKFQGWLRVLFSLPVTIGFFKFGNRNWKHVLLLCMCAVFLSGMSVAMFSPTLFTAFSLLGVWSSFVQAYTIRKNRSRGKVAVELQVIYLLAILCWFVYASVRMDIPLLIVSVGFTLSYTSTILMWVRYPKSSPST